ncbi:MAG: bifunctional riboflavin kinase/FAD synthetase [Rhodanobacteraceae bacterium]
MMKLYQDAAGPCLAPSGSVIAVGAFDGLHRGHAALLARVREHALARGLIPAVVSFEPLPRAFFAREPMPRLGSLREKLQGFAAAGMELVLLLRFDAQLAAMDAVDFVRGVLVERMGAREILVGEDFRFGHQRAGDFALLQQIGGECGFSAHALEQIAVDGERASATRIRELLAEGKFEPAARLLGRPFSIGGRVVRGNRMGHELGYPTANIRLCRRVAPLGGIFAVRVRGRDLAFARCVEAHEPWPATAHEHEAPTESWPGVASLGVRPTVGGTEPLLEAYLFDFDGDLYGKHLEVEFVAKLRDEKKFADLDALKMQMDRDAEEASRILRLRIDDKLPFRQPGHGMAGIQHHER